MLVEVFHVEPTRFARVRMDERAYESEEVRELIEWCVDRDLQVLARSTDYFWIILPNTDAEVVEFKLRWCDN